MYSRSESTKLALPLSEQTLIKDVLNYFTQKIVQTRVNITAKCALAFLRGRMNVTDNKPCFYRPSVTLPRDGATCALRGFFESQARFATVHTRIRHFYLSHHSHFINYINYLIMEARCNCIYDERIIGKLRSKCQVKRLGRIIYMEWTTVRYDAPEKYFFLPYFFSTASARVSFTCQSLTNKQKRIFHEIGCWGCRAKY